MIYQDVNNTVATLIPAVSWEPPMTPYASCRVLVYATKLSVSGNGNINPSMVLQGDRMVNGMFYLHHLHGVFVFWYGLFYSYRQLIVHFCGKFI